MVRIARARVAWRRTGLPAALMAANSSALEICFTMMVVDDERCARVCGRDRTDLGSVRTLVYIRCNYSDEWVTFKTILDRCVDIVWC